MYTRRERTNLSFNNIVRENRLNRKGGFCFLSLQRNASILRVNRHDQRGTEFRKSLCVVSQFLLSNTGTKVTCYSRNRTSIQYVCQKVGSICPRDTPLLNNFLERIGIMFYKSIIIYIIWNSSNVASLFQLLETIIIRKKKMIHVKNY